jgi:hypothetical protein
MDLAEAITYLDKKHTKRPLWKGKRQTKGGLEEPPHPLYPALSNSRTSFRTTLSIQYKIWCEDNNFSVNRTYVGKKIILDYPNEFLDYFAQRLNIPDLPPSYGLFSDFNESGVINKTTAEDLAAKLGPIGVDVLDKGDCLRTAFPVKFLEILQGVIKSDTSLREGYLIDEVLERYQADLLSRHKEHLKSFVNSNPITQACMDVSLAEEIKNFRAFWANRDSLIASAGQ